MTAIKSVVWVVTAHRSFKFGPYVTSVASKAHIVITCFSRESLPTPGSGNVHNRALCDDLLTF